jgi:hypothetical protein
MDQPVGADAVLTGRDLDDRAGAAAVDLDVNADGQTDLVLFASGVGGWRGRSLQRGLTPADPVAARTGGHDLAV